MCRTGVKVLRSEVSKLPVTMLDTLIIAPRRVRMSASTLLFVFICGISNSRPCYAPAWASSQNMWHKSRISNSDESGEASHLTRSCDNEERVHEDGSISADSTTPLLRSSSANERSRLLTEEENRLMNEKIERLVAVIQTGRQLHFSPDSQTGNIDVSITRDKPNPDDGRGDAKADTVASPENFEYMIGTRGGHRRLLTPNSLLSDGTNTSNVRSTSLSSAWENVLAALEEYYTLEPGVEAWLTPPIRENNPIRRGGQYITYIEKDEVKVATVASIPLDFNRPLRILTPSIHSTGSDLDCSSPLFEKSLEALIGETTRDLTSLEEATHDSRSSDLRDSVFDWLERVETPPVLEEQTNAAGKRQDLQVFREGGKDQLAPKRDKKPLTASKALKDVSNLRRPGYLQHNSFAQTDRVNKLITGPARPTTSGPEIQRSGGTADAESSRPFTGAKWAESTPHIRRRPRKDPSPQKSTLQDPNRTADFDLALARLEGRGSPQQYSPIRRYADETGLYGPEVLVERRPLRHYHPVPMPLSPFGQSVAQRLETSVVEVDDNQGGKTKGGSE